VANELNKLEQKWRRVRDFINWPNFSDWTAGGSNVSPVSNLKVLFSSLPFHAGRAEGIEFDPVFEASHVAESAVQSTFERLDGKELEDFSLEKLWRNTGLAQFESKLREESGRRLFSKARIVIPIYPETERDDIDWEYIQKLKTLAYGSGYRPTSPHEKIIKIFARGEILRRRKGDDTWESIAKDLGVKRSTAYQIDEKAHTFVYGHPPSKRRYRTTEEITVPDTPEEIPENPGPAIREKLKGNIDEYGQYKYRKRKDKVIEQCDAIFHELNDTIREECSKCGDHFNSSLGKYFPDPERPYNELFCCDNCLSSV
jgi:hypothetical protein